MGSPLLEHGGRLRAAAKQQGIALSRWLDLSTGINPLSWIPPSVPTSVWQRLPEEEDGLEEAATFYYGCGTLLPVSGSQSAIQALPYLRPKSVVGVVHPIYQEHPEAWKAAGHQVLALPVSSVDDYLGQLDVLILCNPNNPDGRLVSKTRLLEWAGRLANKGGWLIIDEAFMDALPSSVSILEKTMPPGIIVLRSLGKFFGLAGARVGFAMADNTLLNKLKIYLGPWPVSGPSRWIACQALADKQWQEEMKSTLSKQADRAQSMLADAGLSVSGGTRLFHYIECQDAASVQRFFLNHAILIRHFSEPGAIRLGLPGTEAHWNQFQSALNVFKSR